MIPYEKAQGDGGKVELPFNKKKAKKTFGRTRLLLIVYMHILT